MMMTFSALAPWDVTLSPAEHLIILCFLAVTGTIFMSGAVRAGLTATATAVGFPYRTVLVTRLGILISAASSYLLMIVAFASGFIEVAGRWAPNSATVMLMASRYVGWSVAVPLLIVGVLAVTNNTHPGHRTAVRGAVACAFVMVLTAFAGTVVIGADDNTVAFIIFGVISSGFGIGAAVVVVRAIRRSAHTFSALTSAYLDTVALFIAFAGIVYLLAYLAPLIGTSGRATMLLHVILCAADVALFFGLSGFIQKIAFLRTIDDERVIEDKPTINGPPSTLHPEPAVSAADPQPNRNKERAGPDLLVRSTDPVAYVFRAEGERDWTGDI